MHNRQPAKVSRGRKINSTHHFIEAAIPLISAAKKWNAVTKIVPNIIVAARGGKRHLGIRQIPAGLKITVRGSSSLQKIFIYTAQPLEVEAALQKVWDES